jgi:uncharacterized membrane protein
MSTSCRYLLDDGRQCPRLVTGKHRLCAEHTTRFGNDLDAGDLAVYKLVVEKLNNEVSLFWTRANFFVVIQAGLFSIAVSLLGGTTLTNNGLMWGLCLVGLLLAVFWFLVMRSTIRWIEGWRTQVITLDKAVDRFKAVATVEGSPITIIWMRPACTDLKTLSAALLRFVVSDKPTEARYD